MIAADGTRVTAQGLIATRDALGQHGNHHRPTSALPGGYAIKKRGQGTVIADSRIYMHGDDMRYVDRGATARTGHLHVRTFHEERDQVSFLVADFRPAMLWGMQRAFRSVAAAEALAWIGWQAVARGGRVGLMAITTGAPVVVPTRGGTRGMLAVIGGLVRAHDAAMDSALARAPDHGVETDPPLDLALAGLHRIVPRGGSIVIASALDRPGDGFDQVVGQLSQHRSPRFIVVEDAALHRLPAGHYPVRGPDGNRRAARVRKTGADHSLPDIIADHDVVRIDAGLPPRAALAGLVV